MSDLFDLCLSPTRLLAGWQTAHRPAVGAPGRSGDGRVLSLSGSDRPMPLNTTPAAATTSQRYRLWCGTGRPTRQACTDGAASPCGSRTQRWNAGRPWGPSGQARYTNAAIQTSLTKRRRCHTVGSRIDRQHRPASLLSRSVAGGEAWREVAPGMAKAGTWRLVPPAA